MLGRWMKLAQYCVQWHDVEFSDSATTVLQINLHVLFTSHGRTIPQAISLRLSTAAARVRSQVNSCGVYCGQTGIWAGFAEMAQSYWLLDGRLRVRSSESR
jgi:hypothetical protein